MSRLAEPECRLTCKQIADKELPKSRRQQRYDRSALGTDDRDPPVEDKSLKRKRDDAEQDSKLKEFLDVMQPPSKQKAWANEEAQMESQPVPTVQTVDDVAEGDSDEEYQVLSKKPKIAPQKPLLPAESVADATRHKQASEDEKRQLGGNDVCHDAPAESTSGPVSDGDWLRSRTNRVLDLVELDQEVPQSAIHGSQQTAAEEPLHDRLGRPEETTEEVMQQEVDATPSEEDKVRQTGRLFLRNLHFDVTEDDLRKHFAKHGSLNEVGYHHFFNRMLL